MAHQHSPPEMSQKTDLQEPDHESDGDSGVGEDAGEDADTYNQCSATEEDQDLEMDSTRESDGEYEDFTVFVAFQGNMEDEDFSLKLDTVLSGIPNMLNLG